MALATNLINLVVMGFALVAALDKEITAHIARGGSVDDPMGDRIINELIRESLKDKRMLAATHAQMLSSSELVIIYKTMFTHLYPNVLFFNGGPLLVPTALFMDYEHFPSMASFLCQNASPLADAETRIGLLKANAEVVAASIYSQAQLKGKTLPFPSAAEVDEMSRRDASGCAISLIAAIIVLGGAILMLILLR